MTTEAGRLLLAEAHDAAWDAPGPWWHMSENRMGSYIAAIEAEAVATLEIARLRKIEEAARAWNERPSGFMEQNALRAALEAER